MIFGLCFAAAALLIDQVSKWLVLEMFQQGFQGQAYGAYFNLVEAWNTGISFSMLNDGGLWGTIFLTAFALVVVGFLLHWLGHEQNRLLQASLGLVIGGALGNVIDRIRFGAVFDFLDFHYGTWHWPAFNAADSFICIGAFLIVAHAVVNHFQKNS